MTKGRLNFGTPVSHLSEVLVSPEPFLRSLGVSLVGGGVGGCLMMEVV